MPVYSNDEVSAGVCAADGMHFQNALARDWQHSSLRLIYTAYKGEQKTDFIEIRTSIDWGSRKPLE